MTPPVRPELDESTLSDADLWEAKVAQGVSKDSATAYVQGRQRPTAPAPEPLAPGVQAARQEGTPGNLVSFLAGANQGAIPFADEIGAAAGALVTGHPIKNYETNLDYLRERFRMANEANPKTFIAGELGGAVASPVTRALGAGEGALTFGGRVGQAAGLGALGGAVYGAGAAEGGPMGRAKGAVVGGVAGGVMGATLPVLGAVGGGALDIAHARPKVPIRMAPAVDRARAALRPRSGVGGVSGGERAGNIDFTPLARGATAAYNTIGPRSTADAADELLLSAARKAGVPLTAAADATQAAGGAPLTAMEVFGVPAQRLGQASRGISGQADETISTALEARHAGQPERILGAVERGLGQEGRAGFYDMIDEIIERQNATSGPLYEKALSAPPIQRSASAEIDGTTVSLADLLERPSLQKALGLARSIAAERGETPPVIGEDGAVPVKAVDLIKKSLDSMLGFAKTRGTLPDGSAADRETLKAINDTRRALLKIVDKKVPAYGEARNAFAGEAALRDALDSGREAIGKKLDPRLIAREFADLSASEQEMYRQGAIDALQQRMESAGSGANKVLRVFDKPADKARLRALFSDNKAGNDAFDAFVREMEREAKMAQTRNAVLKGSQTAEKLAAQQELEDEGLTALAQAATSPTRAALNYGLRKLGAPRRRAMRSVADALAPRLTQGATSMNGTLMELLNGLTETEKRLARRNATRRAVAASSGATVGSSAGAP